MSLRRGGLKVYLWVRQQNKQKHLQRPAFIKTPGGLGLPGVFLKLDFCVCRNDDAAGLINRHLTIIVQR